MKLSAICSALGCPVPPGYGETEVCRIAAPQEADEASITFLSHPKYRQAVESSRARFVIVRSGDAIAGKVMLEVRDPYVGFAVAGQLLEDTTPAFGDGRNGLVHVHASARIAATAVIGPLCAIGAEAVIGERTVLGAGCIVERGAAIGAGCRIDSGAVIRRNVVIGDRVIVQSGAVIGSEGFGNAWDGERFIRIPQFGTVIIEDDVEIGACVAIDRGALGPTIIRKGVKLDNLIHIAHNVEVGEHSAMAAQVGVSGSTRFGKRVKVGGQAGFVGHIHIDDDAFVGAKAGVSKDVKKGEAVTGYPARELMKMRRIEAAEAELPALLKEVKQLRKRIEALEKGARAR